MEKKLTYRLDEIAKILLSHEGIHEGEWEVGFDIEGAPSVVTRGEQGAVPALTFAFVRVNLVLRQEKTPLSVTAE